MPILSADSGELKRTHGGTAENWRGTGRHKKKGEKEERGIIVMFD